MKRLLLRTLLAAALLLALTAVAGYAWLRGSLPQTDGRVTVDGVRAPVDIVRDRDGVPHIFAASAEDAHFALGFVHAQDRLWQMEMNRRIAAGRMSEILGPATLDTDRFLRTLGVRRAAEASIARLAPDVRRLLEAYAAGVNAYLAQRTGPLPPEFLLTGAVPERWEPADSVAWLKMMAWDMGGNWRSELLRLNLAKTLPSARIAEFMPPYPGDAPAARADFAELYRRLDAGPLAALRIPGLAEAGASNNWVVDGAHSESGKPLLANDPHLGLTAPAVWYFAHLSAPGFDAIGATLPGVVGVILGRNRRLAWGFTNTNPDVEDLYIERLDADGNALTPQGWQKLATRTETIRVKGQPDQTLVVRESRHGPLISDVVRSAAQALPKTYALALRWTALDADDLSAQSAARLAAARDWSEFRATLRDLHAPQQNVVYADVDGNIGFIAPGRIPVRKATNDLMGQAPAPGWDARYDWDGFVPFEALPQSFNPPAGQFVTANQKIVPAGYPYFLGSDWALPYRSGRIAELLAGRKRHSLASFARIQADTVSPQIREVLPLLLELDATSEGARAAMRALAAWDGDMAADRSEPLIASAWLRELTRLVYSDELGPLFDNAWDYRPAFMLAVLTDRNGAGRWCDDVRTPAIETCAQLIPRALELALADLERRYGKDRRQWRWGDAHHARSEHRPFSRQPLLARFFDVVVPTPGDPFSINVGRNTLADPLEPFASRHAASLRALYDLADLDRSLYIHATGQSGNRLSPLYRSFAERWAAVEYLPMSMRRADAENGAIGTLTLQPR